MKITIITINYNNAVGLKRTLDSVASQTYHEFEHIVIDGGSTDGSVDIIKDYVNQCVMYDVLWVSEPDKGIYDAMNKGIKKASGEYLLFLNGGDTLASEKALEEVAPHLEGDDFIIGRVYFSVNGERISTSPLLSEKDMSMYYMYLHGINHQSAFIKHQLLVNMPYDTTVRMNADWQFFVQQIVIRNATVKFVNLIIADFDKTGLSSNTKAVVEERQVVLEKILPERICRDYNIIVPHYYEVIRVDWLLRHPCWYKIYRGLTTFARKITKS